MERDIISSAIFDGMKTADLLIREVKPYISSFGINPSISIKWGMVNQTSRHASGFDLGLRMSLLEYVIINSRSEFIPLDNHLKVPFK